MSKFNQGEIVQLKSGGPKMTVQSIDEKYNSIHCQWFAGSKLNDGHFTEESLIKVTADDKKEKKEK